jgi:hypothetical protein
MIGSNECMKNIAKINLKRWMQNKPGIRCWYIPSVRIFFMGHILLFQVIVQPLPAVSSGFSEMGRDTFPDWAQLLQVKKMNGKV